MKIKTSTILWSIVGLIWSLFMGGFAVSLGLGAEFPILNKPAQPFVCPGGQMELTTQDYQVSPGESGSLLSWYCVDGKSGARTEINPIKIHLYAGLIYGVLLYAVILGIWYFQSRWDPSKASAKARQRVAWVQSAAVILFVVGVLLISLMPLFDSIIPPSTPTPDVRATALAGKYQSLTLGQLEAFTSTGKPLASWNGIPIMTQATTGQQVSDRVYKFRAPVDDGTIFDFYSRSLKPLGWTIQNTRWMGLELTKDQTTLLVTTAPAVDEQSFIVTLSLFP